MNTNMKETITIKISSRDCTKEQTFVQSNHAPAIREDCVQMSSCSGLAVDAFGQAGEPGKPAASRMELEMASGR